MIKKFSILLFALLFSASVFAGTLQEAHKTVVAKKKETIAYSAVVYDTVTTTTAQIDDTETWSHTVADQANKYLIVAVMSEDSNEYITASTVTYNSVSMTLLNRVQVIGNTYINVELWYLAAPATGANNVVVTMAATTDDKWSATAVSAYNVHQTDVPDYDTDSNGTSPCSCDPTVAPISSANDLVVDAVIAYPNLAPNGVNQTARTEVALNNHYNDTSTAPGAAGTKTVTWTAFGTSTAGFVYIACSLGPAS